MSAPGSLPRSGGPLHAVVRQMKRAAMALAALWAQGQTGDGAAGREAAEERAFLSETGNPDRWSDSFERPAMKYFARRGSITRLLRPRGSGKDGAP